MLVSNMKSSKGNPVPNQIIIKLDGCKYFQSYASVIVKIDALGIVYLDETYWNYSRTTSRYRNMFLNELTADTQSKINSGIYTLVDLNGR